MFGVFVTIIVLIEKKNCYKIWPRKSFFLFSAIFQYLHLRVRTIGKYRLRQKITIILVKLIIFFLSAQPRSYVFSSCTINGTVWFWFGTQDRSQDRTWRTKSTVEECVNVEFYTVRVLRLSSVAVFHARDLDVDFESHVLWIGQTSRPVL